MTVEYIRYKISADKQKDFVEAYTKASVQLDQSIYCLGYELTKCEEAPESFILRIEWTSVNDHLEGFRKSTEFAEFFKLVRPFFNDIVEMNHYELTPVVKHKK